MVNAGLVAVTSDTFTQHEDNNELMSVPPLELLEAELATVTDGQVPLRELITRVTQDIYAELVNHAETFGGMDETRRKQQLFQFVLQSKRQVVKLLAIVKWAREAQEVQRAMNVTAFLMEQNHQFGGAVNALEANCQSIKSVRMRNHDLLTSLDVLTTGNYQRLPRTLKAHFIPLPPLTNTQVDKTMHDLEDLIRLRLRVDEILPAQMQRYTIADGRVSFLVDGQFEVSVCARPEDGWFFVGVEFQVNVLGDVTATQDFPRKPPPALMAMMRTQADTHLRLYLPLPHNPNFPPDQQPRGPQLPVGKTDAPMVRLYNYFHMMSLTYQLEILAYQAARLRALGWAEHLKIDMATDRRTLTASYWIRKPPSKRGGRSQYEAARNPLPLLGGKLIVAIEPKPTRRLDDVVWKMGLRGRPPTDSPESFGITVRWEPAKGAWGVETISPEMLSLSVDPQRLDFEALLLMVLRRHAETVMSKLWIDLLTHLPPLSVPGSLQHLPAPGAPETSELHFNFLGPASSTNTADPDALIATLDLRTGQLGMRESSQLSGRAVHVTLACTYINDDPVNLPASIATLRTATILEDVERKAHALGFRCHQSRGVSKDDLLKFGRCYGVRYIQLAQFAEYYLVIVLGEHNLRFALTETRSLSVTPSDPAAQSLAVGGIAGLSNAPPTMRISDIGWLQPRHIGLDMGVGEDGQFRLTPETIKELYAYCCARVSYKLVELQLRIKAIPYRPVLAQHQQPSLTSPSTNPELIISPSEFQAHVPFARAVPVLVVDSELILAGVPAAEAAMPIIQITPLHWWTATRKCQVITSVKLKYVQAPVAPGGAPTPMLTPGLGSTPGGAANTTPGRVGKRVKPPPPRIMRPSESIVYDTQEAVVSFVSDNVGTCVEEFLDQWAKVSRMVVVAREVTTMAKEREWTDVRLLAFDLQTVEFAYAAGYAVTISCTGDLLSAGPGTYSLRFRAFGPALTNSEDDTDAEQTNPHADMAALLESKMCNGGVRVLVELLRASLSVVLELERIRSESWKTASEKENADTVVVDVVAKSCSWFRVLYRGRRALDVRLLDDRAMILDGSHSVHAASDATNGTSANQEGKDWLRPIAEMHTICSAAVLEWVTNSGDRTEAGRGADGEKGRLALLDTGLVCPRANVGVLLRAVHARVRECASVTGAEGS